MTLSRRETIVGVAALGLVPTRSIAATGRTLANPAASAGARALYAYLWSEYGRRTLTGQQETPGRVRDEIPYIERTTGKAPAILGLDYIHPRDWDGVAERAIAWHRAGGIVSICWHWGAPDIGTGYENSKADFDVPAALTAGTPQHRLLRAQMDEVAVELGRLKDAGVPVLWRPFHEFSGDWFWWGKHGADGFKRLWALMYDEYTAKGLDNLIWVLGWAGQNVDAAYYPGRGTVDIAGADIYVEDHGNLAPMFAQVKAIVGATVPICLHENGPIPDPATLGPEADWLWFLTWHTTWLKEKTAQALLREYFRSERYVTRDELPRIGVAGS